MWSKMLLCVSWLLICERPECSCTWTSSFPLLWYADEYWSNIVCKEIKKHIYLWNEGTVDLLQDIVHLQQFGLDEWTVGSTDMADVVKTEVVEDQHVPVVSLEGAIQVACHIVVNLDGTRRIQDTLLVIHRISIRNQIRFILFTIKHWSRPGLILNKLYPKLWWLPD